MTRSDASSIDDLLAHAAWVRSLAHRMVADPHAADDLEQETWVAALEHPPADARNLRGWLARVLLNAARQRGRGEGRRREREQHATERELGATTGELVQRLAVHHELVRAVWDLDEPYRSTILLRFFEELSLKDVAARLDVPVSTVGTRLARGIERLRARMDRDHAGDRAAWATALLPLGNPFAATPFPWTEGGVLLMQAKLKLAAITLGVAATGVALVALSLDPDLPDRSGVATAQRAPRTPDTGQAMLGAPETPRAQRVEAATAAPLMRATRAAEVHALPATVLDPGVVAGRALDADGSGVAGLAIHSLGFAQDDAPHAITAGDGFFAFNAPEHRLQLVGTNARYATLLASVFEPGTPREQLIVVAPRLPLGGLVVGEDGLAVGGAMLRFSLPEGWRSRFTEILDAAAQLEPTAAADPDGRFRLPGVVAVDSAFLVVWAGGFEPRVVELPAQPTDHMQIVLRRPDLAGVELTGMVVDPLGAPVPGARVGLGWVDSVLSDDIGLFRLDLREDDGRFDLIALKPGFLPASMAPPAEWPPFVVLELGGEPLQLAGRVVDEHGAPRPGVLVWAKDPTFFGHMEEMSVQAEGLLAELPTRAIFERLAEQDGDPASFDARMQVESSAFLPRVRTDADGAFRLRGMLARDYTLRVLDDATLRMFEDGPFAAGRSDVVLRLPAAGSVGIGGVVVDGTGAPVSGVSVIPRRRPFHAPWGRDGTYHWQVDGEAALTDADGRFRLDGLPAESGGVMLALESGDVMPADVNLEDVVREARAAGNGVDELTFVVHVRYHLQVLLGDTQRWVDSVRVLDGEGSEMTIRIFGACGYSRGGSAPVVDGRTEVLAVEAGAATVVLRGGDAEPEAHGIRLKRGRLNLIRP